MGMSGSIRSAYLGVNLRPGTRRALREYCQQQNLSASLAASEILEAFLVLEGFDTTDSVASKDDQPLPFDAEPSSPVCGGKA